MRRQRVVVPTLSLEGATSKQEIVLPADIHHYLCRVLRVKSGDMLELCDGHGLRWQAQVVGEIDEILMVSLLSSMPTTNKPFPVWLVQALPKSDRFEQIIQKTTELGVTRIVPYMSQHSVVRLDHKKAAKRHERWSRIIQEASRQSRRDNLPQLDGLSSFDEILSSLPDTFSKIVCWEGEHSIGLKEWVAAHPAPDGVVVFVGPEGGFSPQEVETMDDFGITSVGLGPLILRTETAGPAVLSILQFSYGCLGDAAVLYD